MPEINGVHVPLKDYFDMRITELQRAVDKAENSMAIRLQGMNEFRATISDVQAKSISRAEYDVAHKQLEKDIKDLKSVADVARGKASAISVFVVGGIAIINLIINVIRLLAER